MTASRQTATIWDIRQPLPTDRVVLMLTYRGGRLWGCGRYRAQVSRGIAGSRMWYWKAWVIRDGVTLGCGEARTLDKAMEAALDVMRKAAGIEEVAEGGGGDVE